MRAHHAQTSGTRDSTSLEPGQVLKRPRRDRVPCVRRLKEPRGPTDIMPPRHPPHPLSVFVTFGSAGRPRAPPTRSPREDTHPDRSFSTPPHRPKKPCVRWLIFHEPQQTPNKISPPPHQTAAGKASFKASAGVEVQGAGGRRATAMGPASGLPKGEWKEGRVGVPAKKSGRRKGSIGSPRQCTVLAIREGANRGPEGGGKRVRGRRR